MEILTPRNSPMKYFKHLCLLLLGTFLLFSCSSEPDYEQRAQELAQEFIIVDGHIDVPYRLNSNWEDISKSAPGGDFDYPRAKEGGLDAPFMSIYIPVRYQETGGAKAKADSMINMVKGIASDHPDKFAIATSPQEIKSQFQKDLISLPMGMENGAPIEELSDVQLYYDRGIRYITLAHAKDNRLSDSSYDTTENTHNGLSEFGTKVVKEMNRTGMMVDVSHITDSAFYDVMDATEAPVIATHSSCRHFTPGFERNMSDDLIKRLGQNEGVIMINFGSNFLDSTSQNSSEQVQQADHIDHVVDLVGIDHVGLGSDYDGVGPTLPVGLKDVSEYPNLIAELLKRGYTENEIQKICSGNIFRVWNEANSVADSLQGAESESTSM